MLPSANSPDFTLKGDLDGRVPLGGLKPPAQDLQADPAGKGAQGVEIAAT